MADNVQSMLSEAIAALRLGSAAMLHSVFPLNAFGQQISNLIVQVNATRLAESGASGALRENTRALNENKSIGGAAATIGRALGGTLGFGFGLSPIISGLLNLFGGDEEAHSAPQLPKFIRPAPVEFEGGVSANESAAFEVSRGQSGMIRPIVVQVQAMDSRSFLDHRDEIARAVRQAMLETNALGDAVREL